MSNSPNIVWLVYDSIRQDRTSIGGAARDTTPHLRNLAAADQGTGFTNCIAHAIWSFPSTASMLTGTPPSHHNAGLGNERLPSELSTVPERFSEAGYRTVGLSANAFFSPETGLDRGFDEFTPVQLTPVRESNLLSIAGPWTLAKFVASLHRHSGGFTLDTRKHNSNYLVTEIAKKQLSGLLDDGDPFFYYAHFPGVHHPYVPPKPFRARFRADLDFAPEAAAAFAFDHTTDVYYEIAEGCAYSSAEWTAIRTMYDAYLAYVDTLIGDLVGFIDNHAHNDTIVVVTADHGDLLGEYDLLSHKLVLHDALLNVPLVVSGLDPIHDPDDPLVQHADLMKTLLETAGVTARDIDGIDLRKATREMAVSQRGDATFQSTMEELLERNPSFDTGRFRAGLLTALRTPEYKLVHGDDGDELFDLPDETEDVGDRQPELRQHLTDELQEWLDHHDTRLQTTESVEFSKGTEQRLRDLGYLVE